MSVRNGFTLLTALSALTFSIACGGGNGSKIANPNPTPSGSFANSNLNGTYVFSVAGTDSNGFPYAITGTLTANGGGNGCGSKGVITGGTFDINDSDTSVFTTGPIAGALISNNGSYCLSVDGRGQLGFTTNISGFPNLIFDFVLSSSSHGLITEFDTFGSGSGTLDLQAANTTPTGDYAFSLSGASYSGSTWATVGNFTVAGSTIAGLDDINEGGILSYAGGTLTGSLALTSSAGPATTLTIASSAGSQVFSGTFDAFAIDSTHLKFIEMDQTATLSGDAFSQSSTAFPVGNLAFTMIGASSGSVPFAAGGIMTTTSTGTISGTEDYNQDGTTSSATSPPPFTAAWTAGGAGRFSLGSFGNFVGGTSYAAYPSSGGLLLLEIDNTGITAGAAYTQTAGATFSTSQGYGLNLSGINLGSSVSPAVEVDDIAEFAPNSSGATITGVLDENFAPGGTPNYGLALSGNYVAPDSNGRGQIGTTNVGSSSNSTINGGFALTFYTVDGTIFPFIESDNGQVATGVFVVQNPAAASAAIARSHSMFVPRPLIMPHAKKQK